MATKAARAPRQTKKATDKALLVTMTTSDIDVQFKGPWTGLDVQKIAASLFRYYQQYQQRRLQEARAAAKSAPSQEKSKV